MDDGRTVSERWYGRIGWGLAALGLGFITAGIGQLVDVVAPSEFPLLLIGGILAVVGAALIDAGRGVEDSEDLTEWDG